MSLICHKGIVSREMIFQKITVKKVVLFSVLLLIAAGILSELFPYLASNYPAHLVVLMLSLWITVLLAGISAMLMALKTDRFAQKNYFSLWKKLRSPSLRERREAGKAISALSSQHLKRENKLANVVGIGFFILWGVLVLVVAIMIMAAEVNSRFMQ